MKSSVILAAIAILALMMVEARAQETGLSLNVDAAGGMKSQPQRVPVMVVYEAAQPVQKAVDVKKTGVEKNGAEKTGAEKTGVEKTATVKAESRPPAPMVISGGTTSTPSNPAMTTSTGNARYDELVAQSAARNGVDPNLIVAVMRQESGFNPRALSHKGATGLMQLMPATARRFGVTNIYDPAQNIEGGARYLRFLLDTFNGDVKLVLAGYNAGENAVIRSGYAVPRYRETQNYVRSITARYNASKHHSISQAKTVASSGPVAPSAVIVPAGSSSRLSNNY